MLIPLAYDNLSYDDFCLKIHSFITSKESLLEIISALKHKIDTNNIEEYFSELKPYIMKYNFKITDILSTSHVLCDCCDLYTVSSLSGWVKNNQELFDTEVFFYYIFFAYFVSNIQIDIIPYKRDLFYTDSGPISGQTNNEKLKILYTVVRNYDYINTHF